MSDFVNELNRVKNICREVLHNAHLHEDDEEDLLEAIETLNKIIKSISEKWDV